MFIYSNVVEGKNSYRLKGHMSAKMTDDGKIKLVLITGISTRTELIVDKHEFDLFCLQGLQLVDPQTHFRRAQERQAELVDLRRARMKG